MSPEQKYKKLNRYLQFYCKWFVNDWDAVSLIPKKDKFFVFWHKVNAKDIVMFTIREIPLEDLDKRITSYKDKINRAFKSRNKNDED